LAAIKGYAETLLRREDHLCREERHDFLLAIIEASRRLDGSVTRMLDMSQLAAETPRLEQVPVDVERLGTEAAGSLREQGIVHSSIQPTFLIPREEQDTDLQPPLVVAGDPRRLRDLLDNLLDNAVRYSPDGGVIEVVLRSHGRWPTFPRFTQRTTPA